VVYTDVVSPRIAQGEYVDAADIAITYPSALRVFGFQAEAPSDVHKITCRTTPAGLVCRISPLSVGSKYTVDIAVDQGGTPTVITASRDTVLLPLDEYVQSESRSWSARLFSRDTAAAIVVGILYSTLLYIARRQFRRSRRLKFVGRLVDCGGAAIPGATVRLRVDEPLKYAHDYAAVKTDSDGDFLIEAGEKEEGLRGTIQVVHESYETLEMPFTNPVLFLTLRPNSPRDSKIPELKSSAS
jgi:hypothetical protein